MAKLLDDVKILVSQFKQNNDTILEHINTYNQIYNEEYKLREIKDAEYLKQLMKEKVELGVKTYDNK